MADRPPERYNLSIPPDHPLAGRLDELVEQSDCTSRSEYIREAIVDAEDVRQGDET